MLWDTKCQYLSKPFYSKCAQNQKLTFGDSTSDRQKVKNTVGIKRKFLMQLLLFHRAFYYSAFFCFRHTDQPYNSKNIPSCPVEGDNPFTSLTKWTSPYNSIYPRNHSNSMIQADVWSVWHYLVIWSSFCKSKLYLPSCYITEFPLQKLKLILSYEARLAWFEHPI